MGRSKRGQRPKISYYHMSIHFGIAHGTFDFLNQIWIKEKEVFSGEVSDSSLIFLNDPDAFGGQEREGGISGVVEYYRGTADQEMSQIAASRVGRTTNTMPGYRGVGHLFFRGYEASETGLAPASSQPTEGNTTFFGLIMSAVADLFDSARTVASVLGFQWTANNPYLPGTWAHVTRIGKPFAPEYAGVPHFPVAVATFPAEAPPMIENGPINIWSATNPRTVLDLTDIAFQVDAGAVVLNITVAGTFSPNNNAPDPGGSLQISGGLSTKRATS